MTLGTTSVTWFEGRWHDGNARVIGAADHGAWLGTMVFDGARTFEGVSPDLDLHCARIIRSAEAMGMAPSVTAGEIEGVIRDGISRFPSDAALYLRPMMWSLRGSPSIIDPVPEAVAMCVCIEDLPMRTPGPYALTVSPYRRPTPDSALTEAKAACLYANNGRIVAEAKRRGFTNALSLDAAGNVAETASMNVFLVRGGVVSTPVPNGTFLAGHHAGAGDWASARRWRPGRGGAAGGRGFRAGGRDIFDRQRDQGDAGDAFRGSRDRGGSCGGAGAGALLGIRAPDEGGGMSDMMRVIEISEPGGPEVLRLASRPVPQPGAGEILIGVHAAGVNRPDALQRAGAYDPPKGASDLPGLECAGVVAAVGPGVSRWWSATGSARCCRAGATRNTC